MCDAAVGQKKKNVPPGNGEVRTPVRLGNFLKVLDRVDRHVSHEPSKPQHFGVFPCSIDKRLFFSRLRRLYEDSIFGHETVNHVCAGYTVCTGYGEEGCNETIHRGDG